MNDSSRLNHSRWECKYHIVWIPKYRRKTLFGQLREYLGQIFKDLAKTERVRYWKGI
jgi:putative transposase